MSGERKLTARPVPYSSVVGGGVTLTTETGQAAFQIVIMGTTDGISKVENDVISAQLIELINTYGLKVPERP